MITFYISGQGNDSHDGLSPDTPFRSFHVLQEKLTGISSGVVIYLSGHLSGQLVLSHMQDVFIGSHDIGTAVWESGSETALVLNHCTQVTLSRIKLSGMGYRVSNHSSGILLNGCREVIVRNIEASGYQTSGISIRGSRDIGVTGCFAHDNGAVGINTGSYDGEDCQRISISHCRVYDNAGDVDACDNHSGSGIVIAGAKEVKVEFCDAAGNGWAQRQQYVNGPVGIWCCCGAEDVVMRYNIARYNRTQPGAIDGDGLDIDGESKNVIMEKNYTYRNEGSGYLLCEFWGICTDLLWENNTLRYCVSFEDATRVGGYGPINMSSPMNVPFHKMAVHNNLFVAKNALHAVYNRGIAADAVEMSLKNNILLTDGSPAIEKPDHPQMDIAGNLCLEDRALRDCLSDAAPLISHPRELLEQPIFDWLEKGIYVEAHEKIQSGSLFHATRKPVEAKKTHILLELQLYGADYEGSEKKGHYTLTYDSIAESVVTGLWGAGSEINTPLPWWDAGKLYKVRAKVRLQSPHVVAYLFIRDENGGEQRAFFNQSTAEYGYAELPFSSGDKYGSPGYWMGVSVMEGDDKILIHHLELVEVESDTSPAINGFRSIGDCFETDSETILYPSSVVEKTAQVKGETVFTAECRLEDADGWIYIRECGNPNPICKQPLQDGLNTIHAVLTPETDTVVYGIAQSTQSTGIVRIITDPLQAL